MHLGHELFDLVVAGTDCYLDIQDFMLFLSFQLFYSVSRGNLYSIVLRNTFLDTYLVCVQPIWQNCSWLSIQRHHVGFVIL